MAAKVTKDRDVLILKARPNLPPLVVISPEIDLALDDLEKRTSLSKSALVCKLLLWAIERTVVEPN